MDATSFILFFFLTEGLFPSFLNTRLQPLQCASIRKKKKEEHLHNKPVAHPVIFPHPHCNYLKSLCLKRSFSPSQPKFCFGSRLVIVCLLIQLSVAMNKVRSPVFNYSFATELRAFKHFLKCTIFFYFTSFHFVLLLRCCQSK